MKFARKDSLFSANPPANGGMDHERALPAPTREPVRPRGTSPATQLNAFLGRGCIYEGKLTFEGRVRIDGKFTGEIFSNDTLEVGPDAEIEAEIDVANCIIAGHVDGNIMARVRCDLRAPGVILGNITAPIITMDEGVRFDGEMRMVNQVLEDAARASTQRAPAAIDLADTAHDLHDSFTDETAEEDFGAEFAGEEDMVGEDTFDVMQDGTDRPDAMGIPDPSDLLKPTN
jgi:cytoskeletal protein CcmA (bactofilin family)